jgi:hypothetical protein
VVTLAVTAELTLIELGKISAALAALYPLEGHFNGLRKLCRTLPITLEQMQRHSLS